MIERPDGCYPLRVQPDLAAVSIVGALTNLTSTPPARQSSGSFRSFNIGPHNTSTATQGKDGRRCIRIATAYANLMVWSCPQRFCPFPA
jgi:type IV fimbrial biogenesis protein FimT